MRVCIVTVAGGGVGGMQDHTRDLAARLGRTGHEVAVIAPRRRDGQRQDGIDGVEWHLVDAPGQHMHSSWRRASHETFEGEHSRHPFDVVHSEGSSGLELVRRRVHHRVPLVVEFHGNFLGLAKASFARAMRGRNPRAALKEARGLVWLCGQHFPHGNWFAFRSCEAIVPSRQQIKDTRRSHMLHTSRIHVVPNGVDTELFRPRPRSEIRKALRLGPEPLLACVGRLNHEKGFHHAIRALALLDGEAGDARLVIVGGGEENERLRELVRRLGVESRVVFAGPQPAETVAAYLAGADIFLFPTQRDEAAPLVLPQAMSSGLPVVASAIGGIPEVIDRPGENGILVPPGNVEVLAAATHDLLTDEDLRRRLGDAARRRVLAEYTLELMTERTLAVYRIAAARLLEARTTRGRKIRSAG